MGKSKYPNNYDTSAEIPAVRDNVLEIGSDVINSVRAAIFQIERTLGINPQGSSGNTVASRLNQVIDENGNLLDSAIDKVGILSGPVLDSDISDVASISERKLNLDFSTKVLQSQILSLYSTIENLSNSINELTSNLSIHVNPNVKNRHPASSISISKGVLKPSKESTNTLETGNVQSVIEEIYSSHINFDDVATSSNKSHDSSQIFFDNENVSSYMQSNDVQSAIEESANLAASGFAEHQEVFHSNGVLNKSSILDPYTNTTGDLLFEDLGVSFSKSIGEDSWSRINLLENLDLGDLTISTSDILEITDGEFEKEFQIARVNTSGSGVVESFDVFDKISLDSTSNALCTVRKNHKYSYNKASLLSTIRYLPDLSESNSIQIANPNAVFAVSSGIMPSAIDSSTRYFNISIDEGADMTIDIYDGTVSEQSIDSIISKINKQVSQQSLNFAAYRLEQEGKSDEIAIVHNIPDEDSIDRHSLKISRASDDGIDALGFSHIEDQEQRSVFGTSYVLNGNKYSGLGTKLDTDLLSYFSSTNLITNGNSDFDFISLGITEGDLLVLSNSDSDDGTYLITNVNENSISLSSDQLASGFSSASSSSTRFRVFKNIVSFSNLNFKDVSDVFGSALLQIFMDKDRNINYNILAEYAAELSGTDSLVKLVNCSDGAFGKEFVLSVESGDLGPVLSLDEGKSVEVIGNNNYIRLFSNKNAYLDFYIDDYSEVQSAGEFEINIQFFDSVNNKTNLLLCKALFESFRKEISGGINSPRVFSDIEVGSIGKEDVSFSISEKIIGKSSMKNSANGILEGFDFSDIIINSDDQYQFTLSPGISKINGVEIEYHGDTYYNTKIESSDVDNIFVATNKSGKVLARPALTINGSCYSPFDSENYADIFSLENDGTNLYITDRRFYLPFNELKSLNKIIVSKEKGLGHFNTLSDALSYAKRFSQIYKNSSIPEIYLAPGVHEYSIDISFDSDSFSDWYSNYEANNSSVFTTIYNSVIESKNFIDFPVRIDGAGESSVLDIKYNYNFSDISFTSRGELIIFGDGFSRTDYSIDKFNSGRLSISNVNLRNTRIVLVDHRIYNSSGTNLFFFSNFQNIIFDFENNNYNLFDSNYGDIAFEVRDDSDLLREKGNFILKDCSFVDCQIKTQSTTSLRNASFLGNYLFKNNSLELFADDIYNFSSLSSGKDVNIVGNINVASTFDSGASEPSIEAESSTGWGDRFSRNIIVGGDIKSQKTIYAETAVQSASFKYPDTKTKEFIFTWIGIDEPDLGPVSGSYLTNTASYSPGYYRVAIMSSGTYVYRHITLPAGLNISSIEVGVIQPSDYTWNLSLSEVDLIENTSTTVYSDSKIITNSGYTFDVGVFDEINYETNSDKTYVISLNPSTISICRSIYFKVITTFTEIEDVIGV